MITGAAGGGGSDDDAMSAFHGQCARQKRRSRKKYSASSAPQTRQPVKNGCAVLSVRRAVAGDGGAQALAPNFALSSLRRASERTKLIGTLKANAPLLRQLLGELAFTTSWTVSYTHLTLPTTPYV